MNLVKINEVVGEFGLSSRTLRYYEQVGILWSFHPENKIQRYYDDAAIECLKQIIILRKLQIPVKDIAAIFKDNSPPRPVCRDDTVHKRSESARGLTLPDGFQYR